MPQGAASRVAPRAHGAALLNHAELPECFKVRRQYRLPPCPWSARPAPSVNGFIRQGVRDGVVLPVDVAEVYRDP